MKPAHRGGSNQGPGKHSQSRCKILLHDFLPGKAAASVCGVLPLDQGSVTIGATIMGVCAVAIGAGTLLAAWGISFLWRYTPPEIAIRIANPEVSVTQNRPLIVEQDGPFTMQQPGPL